MIYPLHLSCNLNSWFQSIDSSSLESLERALVDIIIFNLGGSSQMDNTAGRSRVKENALISLKKRQELVQRVVDLRQGLKSTAKALGIKLSTAKLILKRFKTDGTFFESHRLRRARLIEQQQEQNIREQCASPADPEHQESSLVRRASVQVCGSGVQSGQAVPSVVFWPWQEWILPGFYRSQQTQQWGHGMDGAMARASDLPKVAANDLCGL